MIFGRPESGKSTFAKQLCHQTGIPLYHLDRYFFIENWVERDEAEFLEIQRKLVAQDCWINY
ncbi:AAA family ATPase [Candidatus Paracaedibacter symbiosus]|uniref:AAA family ATPase n=1 Tax=Candidatus Paracaedibacter symbiosus TaxID=244582 RepID=UPI00068A0AA3|nr:AAA family ATPase [Candidatus Paracaedibacter symbiosus]